jgi:hypothetical protein
VAKIGHFSWKRTGPSPSAFPDQEVARPLYPENFGDYLPAQRNLVNKKKNEVRKVNARSSVQ